MTDPKPGLSLGLADGPNAGRSCRSQPTALAASMWNVTCSPSRPQTKEAPWAALGRPWPLGFGTKE